MMMNNWTVDCGDPDSDGAVAVHPRALVVADPLHLRAQDQKEAQLLGETHRPVSSSASSCILHIVYVIFSTPASHF